jgi:hypothetical protein
MIGWLSARRVPLGWRMVSQDWVRFSVTVSGTGVALALMLFLAGRSSSGTSGSRIARVC